MTTLNSKCEICKDSLETLTQQDGWHPGRSGRCKLPTGADALPSIPVGMTHGCMLFRLGYKVWEAMRTSTYKGKYKGLPPDDYLPTYTTRHTIEGLAKALRIPEPIVERIMTNLISEKSATRHRDGTFIATGEGYCLWDLSNKYDLADFKRAIMERMGKYNGSCAVQHLQSAFPYPQESVLFGMLYLIHDGKLELRERDNAPLQIRIKP